MTLEELRLLESHMEQLGHEIAALLEPQQQAVQRLAEVPGFGVDSAQQIIAEVGPTAAVFPSEKDLCSWVGCAPEKKRAPRFPRALDPRKATAPCGGC